MASELQRVLEYHERTAHRPGRYAASLGYLDWDTQPNPFRLYDGAERLVLPRPAHVPGDSPTYADLFRGRLPADALDLDLLGSLFFHALALSAWKQHGSSRWSLRVNPSSGNLHPTEAYLLAGPLAGLSDEPGLYHYSPLLHGLERRAALDPAAWRALEFPGLLVGLTSIAWREAWKYGERAFRYCNHDVGHAIAALAFAAALHGWRAVLLDPLPDRELAALLGVAGHGEGVEAERPECLLALVPATAPRLPSTPQFAAAAPVPAAPTASSFALSDAAADPAVPPTSHRDLAPGPAVLTTSQARLSDPAAPLVLDPAAVLRLAPAALAGEPNQLSEGHHAWEILDDVADATAQATAAPRPLPPPASPRDCDLDVPAAPLIRRRRSAVAMDGRTGITAPAFYDMLLRTLPEGLPLSALPWRPAVDLALMVHRVEGVDPGIYLLVRDPARGARWRAALPDAVWQPPPACPDQLPLVCLARGDVRRSAALVSCAQDIAADGCFSLGMFVDLRAELEREGPAHYRRLYWETGAIGQLLYLEAEALGIAATGIGCFFDQPVRHLIGLPDDDGLRSLYHFTIGGRLDDTRLRSLDAYHHLDRL